MRRPTRAFVLSALAVALAVLFAGGLGAQTPQAPARPAQAAAQPALHLTS